MNSPELETQELETLQRFHTDDEQAPSQRWHEHRHSFINPDHGVFDPRRYSVVPLPEAQAKAYVLEHHYSRSYPSALARFGLILDSTELVGVAVYSVPVHPKVLTNVFPDVEPRQACELGRLVLDGAREKDGGSAKAPHGAESWFIARTLRHLHQSGMRAVVTFADPVPRPGLGGIVLPGHIGSTGVIYQSTNFIYTGRGTARRLIVLPDGRSLSERALQKVRTGDTGSAYVMRRLEALGAQAWQEGQDARQWLEVALAQVGAATLRHGGNHRYALALGPRRRQARIALESLAYPKLVDPFSPAVPLSAPAHTNQHKIAS
jgi:hypothetical protein